MKNKKTKKEKQQKESKYQQKEKIENDSSSNLIQKESAQDSILKFPSKMLEMTNRCLTKLETSLNNLRLEENKKIDLLPQLGFQQYVEDFNLRIFNKYMEMQQDNTNQLVASIKAVPKIEYQLQKIEIPQHQEPLKRYFSSNNNENGK